MFILILIYNREAVRTLRPETVARDETLDDPSFYQQVETNIYDEHTRFTPSLDYQKKCSIKKKDEGAVVVLDNSMYQSSHKHFLFY